MGKSLRRFPLKKSVFFSKKMLEKFVGGGKFFVTCNRETTLKPNRYEKVIIFLDLGSCDLFCY